MSIALIIADRDSSGLRDLLQAYLPEVHIQQWPDLPNPETVKLAVLWQHPAGITRQFPHLKAVTSLGAGMDHIHADEAITDSVQQLRIMTRSLQQRMAQYVLAYVLQDWRNLKRYQKQQQDHQWQVLETDASPTVGFLGLGALGGFVADNCNALGFRTVAWTRQQKHAIHSCYHGPEGLKKVCENSDYLVVLLPLNKTTEGIINKQTLGYCQPHCMLINVGRGGHVKDVDLTESLANKTIRHAVLDVFNEEPLADNHPFWDNPNITLTPHISARSDDQHTAEEIVAYYRALSRSS